MKVLFLTQYFPPETGAAQNRLSDLACRLAAAGHRVTVLTAVPSYPKGRIFDGYRGRPWMTEEQNGVRIVRTWLFVTKRRSFVFRILNYLCFSVMACLVSLLTMRQMDIVFAESPPLFVGVAGYILSKAKGAKFVLNISDLWPESAVVLGMLRNKSLIRWATRVEEGLYRRASLITAQTQGIVTNIEDRILGTRIVLLTNGVAPEFLAKVDEARLVRSRTREEMRLGLKFTVAYTGLHGLAQGLETIIEAAQIVFDREEILFVFWGDGPEKPKLQSMALSMGLHNVVFLPAVQVARMPELLAAVDVSIVSLRKDDLFKGALPSKLFEAIGAGVPVIGAVNGEAQSFIINSGGGIVVAPECPSHLASAIIQLSEDSAFRQQMGDQGRKYVERNYDRKHIFKIFEQLLTEISSTSNTPIKAIKSVPPKQDSGKYSMNLDLK
jgi:glycosyltransferase involved in cell wall biosynthesis